MLEIPISKQVIDEVTTRLLSEVYLGVDYDPNLRLHYEALVRSTIKYLLEVYDESTTNQQTIETPAIASPSKSEPRSEDWDDYWTNV